MSMNARSVAAMTALTLLSACGTKTEVTSSAVSVRHQLPNGFAFRGTVGEVEMLLDEPADAGALFAATAATMVTTTDDGYPLNIITEDADGDGRVEMRIVVLGSVFASRTAWTFDKSGSALGNGFIIRAKLRRPDGGVMETVATGVATTTDDYQTIQFGGGLKNVTLLYDCAPGVACVADGG